jgi:hypothetical protein
MGHEMLEQEPGKKPAPATELKPEEIALASELWEMIEKFSKGTSSGHIDFKRDESLPINSRRGVYMVEDGRSIFAESAGAWLLDSKEWPIPEWTPTEANISRMDHRCSIEIRGYKGIMVPNYGLRFSLDGNYPRINNIVPEDSLEATREERRNLDGKRISPDPVWKAAGRIMIPARDGRLRPRKNRLEYGKFLIHRICIASGAKLIA